MTDRIAAPVRTVWIDDNDPGSVMAIEQRLLPFVYEEVAIRSADAMAEAIRDMVVRGAGCIGASAGYGMYLAALETGVRKVVYASSSSVYGDDPGLPKVEDRTGRPLSPYAASKQISELYANTLSRPHGLPAVGLRYFNVVGTRQGPEGP